MSQFYSSWVPETATTWSTAYKVKDLDIASLECRQEENNCATLTVTVRNPQIGLLAPGRLVWLWLAWENDAGTTVPIFFGRLVPVPNRTTNMGEGATLSFVARPLNFEIQKVAAALALQVLPYYDPIFIDPANRLAPLFGDAGTGGGGVPLGEPRPPQSTANPDIVGYSGDPDSVLEGWPRLWSIDRVTGIVGSSDILEGEDGVEVFNADEIPEASIQINTASSVLDTVTVVGKVNWTQSGGGNNFDVTIAATVPNGLDLINEWPKAGSSLAGGYTVNSTITADWQSLAKAQVLQRGWRYENKAKQHKPGDVISISWNYAEFPKGLSGSSYLISESVQQASAPQLGDHLGIGITGADEPNLPFHFNANIMVIAQVPMSATMNLGPDPKLGRNETVTIKLAADIQPLVVLNTSASTPSAASPISINGSDVGVAIDGVTPISGPSASNYFPSDRGQQSIEYLISVGVAHLKSANRAVTVSWDTTFERAVALSCRKNATINARLIPGGTATGKIIAYSFTASGADLGLKGNVTIGCCVGTGGVGTVTGTAGTDALAVPGTLKDTVAVQIGASNVVGGTTAGGDISYSPPIYVPQPNEPTFPLSRGQMVVAEFFSTEIQTVTLGKTINNATGEPGPDETVNVPISIFNLELLNLTGSFANTYDLSSTPLKLPKQIDLTVPSW